MISSIFTTTLSMPDDQLLTQIIENTTPYVLSRVTQCLNQSFIAVTIVLHNHPTNCIKCFTGNLEKKITTVTTVDSICPKCRDYKTNALPNRPGFSFEMCAAGSGLRMKKKYRGSVHPKWITGCRERKRNAALILGLT